LLKLERRHVDGARVDARAQVGAADVRAVLRDERDFAGSVADAEAALRCAQTERVGAERFDEAQRAVLLAEAQHHAKVARQIGVIGEMGGGRGAGGGGRQTNLQARRAADRPELLAAAEPHRLTRQAARRQAHARRLVGGRQADLVVELDQPLLAEPKLAVVISSLRHDFTQQQARDFFAALQVHGGHVLIAPRDEADAALGGGYAQLDAGVDLAHDRAGP
jgi:hypothetical protein